MRKAVSCTEHTCGRLTVSRVILREQYSISYCLQLQQQHGARSSSSRSSSRSSSSSSSSYVRLKLCIRARVVKRRVGGNAAWLIFFKSAPGSRRSTEWNETSRRPGTSNEFLAALTVSMREHGNGVETCSSPVLGEVAKTRL